MKTLFVVFALCVATTASADCYQIFNANGELVWRDTKPPVSMDTGSPNEAVQRIVPKGHLQISSASEAHCTFVDQTGKRDSMRDRVEKKKYD
jgi:hypothetical protein